MFKKTILISLLATAGVSAFAADYYVVVPLTGKQALLNGISVSLNSTSLPAGVVGVPYAGFDLSQSLQVSGDPAYSSTNVGWSVVAGALPAGLVLNKGVISGAPTAAGEQSFSVRATYKTKTGEQAYKILAFVVTVALATGTLPQGVVGVAYPTYDLKPLLTVAGDPSFNQANVTWGVVSSTLPAGLTLKADGTIAGTPTAAGIGAITARASYKGINGEQSYQIVALDISVSMPAATLPKGLVGDAYSYNFNPLLAVAGDPAYGGTGASWDRTAGSLPGGLVLNANGTLTGTPTAASTGVSFQVRATYKTKTGTNSFSVTVDPLVVTGALTADTSVDFGSVSVGQSVTRNFSFKNTGNGAATGATVSVTGVGMSVVAPTTCGVAGTPVSVAKTNGICSIAVKYAPTAGGAVAGAVTESWTGPATGSKSLAISAYGLVDYSSLMVGYTGVSYADGLNPAWTTAMGSTWYWRSPGAATNAVAETVVFRQAITVAGTASVSAYLHGATDDVLVNIAVNGVGQPGNSGWGFGGVADSTPFTLLPGVNVIETQVTNGGGPAGLAIELRKGDGTLLAPVSAWKFSP